MYTLNQLGRLLAGSGLLLAGLVQAAPAIDWAAFNSSVISGHIQPRYQQLASQTQTLAQTSARWCESRDSSEFPAVQRAFDNSLQAWEGIQHVQFGPVQLLMRNYGIQFWPDRKGITGRQLQAALNGPDAGQYDDAFFHQASISIKGFPALERLFYGTDALSQLQQHPHACALATAISARLAQTSQELATEWQTVAFDDQHSENDDGTTTSLPNLSLDLLRALVQPVEVIRDSKLDAVLGDDQAGSRLQRAENWRSGQSLTSITGNLEALQELYAGGDPSLDRILRGRDAAAQADRISALFSQARAQLDSIPVPFATALADAGSYGQLHALSATLKSLDQALYDAMPAIDAQLGFNSRDGD
jgi:predicted lipoprotein